MDFMDFTERSRIWDDEYPDSHIEIRLAGDEAGPLAVNVEMAAACKEQIESLIARAVEYVARHIAPSSAIVGEPEIQGIDFGLTNYGEHREFEIYFSDDATYVLWAVRFSYHPDYPTKVMRMDPVGFSRRGW